MPILHITQWGKIIFMMIVNRFCFSSKSIIRLKSRHFIYDSNHSLPQTVKMFSLQLKTVNILANIMPWNVWCFSSAIERIKFQLDDWASILFHIMKRNKREDLPGLSQWNSLRMKHIRCTFFGLTFVIASDEHNTRRVYFVWVCANVQP